MLRNFGISNVAVVDHDGKAIPFTSTREGTYIRLKIGDERKLVSGVREYRISYTASTIMRGYSKFDEWLWDVTSSNWPVPIVRGRVNVIFPRTLPIQDLVRSCVTLQPEDTKGKESCQVGFIDRTSDGKTISVQAMDLNMAPKESMHIGLGFPKGFIKNVSEVKAPVSAKYPPLTVLLPVSFMFIMIGFGAKEILRRKWPHLVKE